MRWTRRIMTAATAMAALAGLAFAGAGPAAAGSPPIPDLSVKRVGGAWSGDGVYAGAVGQVAQGGMLWGETLTFKVRIQQDTTHVVPLTIDGDSSSTHFRIRYFKGQNNITKAVKQGTYTTPPLTTGQNHTIKMLVTSKDGETSGLGFFVTGSTPGGVPDTVLVDVWANV